MARFSYEDMSVSQVPEAQDLLEAFSGSSIVAWSTKIRYKLLKMADDQDNNRNAEYAQLIRNFLNTWQANPITGSINRDTLEILKAAAEPLSLMNWNQASYFQGLVGSLDELIADQEQLPTGVPTDQNNEFQGGAGMSMPPMGDEFGAQKEPPPGGEEAPGAEGDLGKPGEPGAEEGGEPKPIDEIPIK